MAQILSSIRLNSNEDKLVWKLSKNGAFFVKSLYFQQAGHTSSASQKFPSNIIWKSKAPPRISFFAWEAAIERILTMDNLQMRGNTVVNRCYFVNPI